MSADQPSFRFNPGAYEDGHSFERSSDLCEVCSRPCVWRYTGGIYATEHPVVCARCIANVLDARPLAFVGYGEDEDLLDIAAVRSAIEAAFGEIGRTFDGPTSYALVFKEIDGERYRAVVDLD